MSIVPDLLSVQAGRAMRRFNDTFFPLASPEHCPGAYELHLYCKYKNPDHGFAEFPWILADEETRPAAERSAREAGWIIHRDGTATCPKCAKRLIGAAL